jgi:hypothetical protein
MTIVTGNLEPVRPPARDDDCGCGGTSHAFPASGASDGRAARSAPAPLERNAFYPRKLMEVRHWQAEQDYHRRSRQLLTRLATGSGILCGLDVVLTEEGTLVVEAGVAVDGRGREIVVPHDVEIDPAQPTDACGRSSGDRLTEGSATIALCYRECGTDVVAIPSESCEGETRCVPSMIKEAFAVTVRPGAWKREHDPLCAALWGRSEKPDESGEIDEREERAGPRERRVSRDDRIAARRERLDRLAPRDCGCAQRCVPLATVVFGGERGTRIDRSGRTVIRSNTELLELILCLAEQLEECCRRVPTAPPPRIADVFPWPDEQGSDLTTFASERRVEIAFDRPIDAGDLAAPDPWLGLWMLRGETALRIKLTFKPNETTGHVSVPPGGAAAVYTVTAAAARTMRTTGPLTHVPVGAPALLIMVRSGGPGVIRAADSDRLALDADLTATKLTAAEREELWNIPVGSTAGFSGAASATSTDPIPPLPSGDGDVEGDLHVILPLVPPKPAAPPHLVRVWPAGGRAYAVGEPDADEFLEVRHLRITVSTAIDPSALADPHHWLRAWRGAWDFVMQEIQEIALEPGTIQEEHADGSVTYAFALLDYEPPTGQQQILAGLWPDAAVPAGGAPPVGAAGAQLLDADFAGTKLDTAAMEKVWQSMPPQLPDLEAVATDGKQLHDGTEGGIAFWAFQVFGN